MVGLLSPSQANIGKIVMSYNPKNIGAQMTWENFLKQDV